MNGEDIFYGYEQAELSFAYLESQMLNLDLWLIWERMRTAVSLSVRSEPAARLAVQKRQKQVRFQECMWDAY